MKSVAVEVRLKAGKSIARSIRRDGKLPCVIYGGDKPPVSGSICAHAFDKIAGADLYNTAFDAVVDGKAEQVLCRMVQFCPITEKPLHVDFMRVVKGQPVVARVPVVFEGRDKCPGLLKKGTLNTMLRFVHVRAPSVEFLPQKAVVDLRKVDVGVTLGMESISVPEGVAIKEVGKTVAKMIPPRVSK